MTKLQEGYQSYLCGGSIMTPCELIELTPVPTPSWVRQEADKLDRRQMAIDETQNALNSERKVLQSKCPHAGWKMFETKHHETIGTLCRDCGMVTL